MSALRANTEVAAAKVPAKTATQHAIKTSALAGEISVGPENTVAVPVGPSATLYLQTPAVTMVAKEKTGFVRLENLLDAAARRDWRIDWREVRSCLLAFSMLCIIHAAGMARSTP